MAVTDQMGKVLVLRQIFHPGNGEWVTWQLLCVVVWAELLPAARDPRVAPQPRAAARGAPQPLGKGHQVICDTPSVCQSCTRLSANRLSWKVPKEGL